MVGAFPVIFTAEALDTFYHHGRTKSGQNGNVTGFPAVFQETPQIMPRLLMGFWACDGMHLVSAGIQSTGDALIFPPLPAASDPHRGNDHRNLLTGTGGCAAHPGAEQLL